MFIEYILADRWSRTNPNFAQTQTSNKSKFPTNQKVSGLRGTQNNPALGRLRIIRPWGDLESSGVRGTQNNSASGSAPSRFRTIRPPVPSRRFQILALKRPTMPIPPHPTLGTVTRRFLRSLITNLKSKVKNSKWRMASNYMILQGNFKNFALIRSGTVTQGFLRSLITNLK